MRNIRRRRAIALFITLGVCMVALAVTLQFGWIILNWRRLVPLVLGIPFFALLIAGVILNTIFLVREVRRNEHHDSFLNAVTHELKTPVASIRLYLETLQRRSLPEEQRQEFYSIMLSDSNRLLATIEQVLKAGEVGQRAQEEPGARRGGPSRTRGRVGADHAPAQKPGAGDHHDRCQLTGRPTTT